jgi:progressive ankylosis protein
MRRQWSRMDNMAGIRLESVRPSWLCQGSDGVALPGSVLTQRHIFFFWLPLAASWALMSAEGPVLQAAIARLPDMQTQLAAFGIVMSLEIAIESPVIMLLATSTALCTSGVNFRVVRSFMGWSLVLVTIVSVAFAFTALYGLIVVSLMRIPVHIAAAARPGMQIMTLWSAAIGLRRFLQGVLIRYGQTRWVGIGTAARLSSSAGTGIALALTTCLPGVQIASIALMAGVGVEALFVSVVSRSTVKRVLESKQPPEQKPLGLRDVAHYHMPLAATSLLTLMAQPLIGGGLARMPHPEENLAAWPVIWGLLFIFRSAAFALPEAVIALSSERRLALQVRSFCTRTGVASTSAMALLAATPLLGLYLRYVAGIPENLARLVIPGVFLAVVIPYINSIHSWYRGVLMYARNTRVIYWGMGLNLAVTALLVYAGVVLRTPGAQTGIVAVTTALVIEVFYLKNRTARGSASALGSSSRTR